MINVWVTGSKGQLGQEIKNNLKKGNSNFLFTSKKDIDITNKEDVERFIKLNKIKVIINCAAYTNVDDAEKNTELAFRVNSDGVLKLVQCCKKLNSKLIHISTDFIFNSISNKPINENKIPNPICIYAKSKYNGEQHILNSSIDAIIIRSSWIYSEFGKNFLKTIIKISNKKKYISVIDDQIGTPTYADDLAKICIIFVKRYKKIKGQNIFNYSNLGECSWYDFAIEIKKNANLKCFIKPIKTQDFNSLAKRPRYSVLDKRKIEKELGIKIPFWKDSLKNCIKKII